MNPHSQHHTSIRALFGSVWRNRQLIAQMTKREVVGRYRGSVMGMAWSFFNPVLMLTVYTFVFAVVFKARWGLDSNESKSDFAMLVFVGMILHGLFAECVNRAPGLILGNVNYVKKVLFPLEILPWIALGSALFHAAISMLVLIAAQVLLHGTLHWTLIVFPVILLPLLLATLGVAWFLASLGVYVRDIGQITGVFTTVMMFLSPVFYPVASLPENYQVWLRLNPLTYIIEEGRNVLVHGLLPDWSAWLMYTLAGLVLAWLGYAWFQKTRRGFADVI